MDLRFQNPQNGHIEKMGNCGLWSLLFGFFYFAAKGIWTHAIIGIVLGACTLGLSWLVYPFFAKGIVRAHYLRKGWVDLASELSEEDEAAAKRASIIDAGRRREMERRSQPSKDAAFDAMLQRAGERLAAKQAKKKGAFDDGE